MKPDKDGKEWMVSSDFCREDICVNTGLRAVMVNARVRQGSMIQK